MPQLPIPPPSIPFFSFDLPLDRVLDQLTPTVQEELFLDVGLISFDSLYAEVQFLGNLARASALADQTKDL